MRRKIQRVWYALLRGGLRILFAIFWKTEFYGKENVPNEGPVLVLGNHQSYLDPPAIGLGIKRHCSFVARSTLFDNRFFGWLIDSVNAIPIKRGTADLAAMKLIIGKLKTGAVVVMFPEATRTPDGNIAEIKAGFGLLAKRSGATVVPAIIDGAFEVWPRTKKKPGMGKLTIQYGKAISPEHINSISNEDFALELTSTLRQMQTELRTRLGKEPFTPKN